MDPITVKDLTVRLAQPSDAEGLYSLASHPEVRKTTFRPAPFTLESHLAWFAEKLRDPNYLIFLVVGRQAILGYVRYEKRASGRCEVHIAVHPDAWGKGVGTFALKSTLSLIPKPWKCGEVIAQVLERNMSSLKIFEKAGFKPLRKVDAVRELVFDLSH